MFFAIPAPNKEQFELIAKEFEKKWNLPNVYGCIDGKHVRVRCPNSSGSLFYNYKDYFSIVLLALVDANCKFIGIDIGSYGREGDAGIFSKCALGKAIRENLFDLPSPKMLPNSETILPYVVLGDEAFPLLNNLMKPYPRSQSLIDRSKAIFNYLLSRARRIVENSFGMLTHRFRMYCTPIHLKTETMEDAVTATCIIHNILADAKIFHDPTSDVDQNVRLNSLEHLEQIESQQTNEPTEIRNKFKEYFDTIGAVSWQNETIRL